MNLKSKIKVQKEMENWLLRRIRAVGNTPESTGRGLEKYEALIGVYKEMIALRPAEMIHLKVVKFHI